MPWKRYDIPELRKLNRLETVIILGTVGIGVLVIIAAKLFS
jgi:hypothetical protein